MICYLVVMLQLLCQDVFTVKHNLRYFLTASSGSPPFPEFTAFSTLDDVQWGYCDSSGRVEPQHKWIKRILQDSPQSFEYYAHKCERYKYLYKDYIENLKEQINQSEGVHIFQRIHGCEWDDETGETAGFNQFGYNGEDFLSFDLETLTWVAAKPQALITKHKWDSDVFDMEVHKIFYIHRCPERLKKYLGYLNRFKKRTAAPSVFLLQKTPSSPVSCHSTGFYPDHAVMFWRRDGLQVHEDVQYWEILRNHDHTFQMTVVLNISQIKAEDWRRYECVFQLPGLKEEIVTRLDRGSIITNWVPPSEFPVGTVVAVVVAGLLLVLCISGLFYFRKRMNTEFWPTNLSDLSGSQTSSEAEALK